MNVRDGVFLDQMQEKPVVFVIGIFVIIRKDLKVLIKNGMAINYYLFLQYLDAFVSVKNTTSQ